MQALTTIAGAIIEWKYHILGTCPTYEANRPEMSARKRSSAPRFRRSAVAPIASRPIMVSPLR
jgi:hypothetical protein